MYPPHTQQPGMGGMPGGGMGAGAPRRSLDPDHMPSPIAVMEDDQRNNGGDFNTNEKVKVNLILKHTGLCKAILWSTMVALGLVLLQELKAHQDHSNATPQLMCEFQLRLALLRSGINPNEPQFTAAKECRFETQILMLWDIVAFIFMNLFSWQHLC